MDAVRLAVRLGQQHHLGGNEVARHEALALQAVLLHIPRRGHVRLATPLLILGQSVVALRIGRKLRLLRPQLLPVGDHSVGQGLLRQVLVFVLANCLFHFILLPEAVSNAVLVPPFLRRQRKRLEFHVVRSDIVRYLHIEHLHSLLADLVLQFGVVFLFLNIIRRRLSAFLRAATRCFLPSLLRHSPPGLLPLAD